MGLAVLAVVTFVIAAHSNVQNPAATVKAAVFKSFADAADAGEVERGWLAASVPSDATDVAEWHNLDTSECYGVFTLARSAALDPSPAPAELAQKVAAARRVHPSDTRLPKIARSKDVFVSCHDSGKFTSIEAVIARDAEAGVYWCVPKHCERR